MTVRKSQRMTTQYSSGRVKLHVDDQHFRLVVPGTDRVLTSEVHGDVLMDLRDVLVEYFKDRAEEGD